MEKRSIRLADVIDLLDAQCCHISPENKDSSVVGLASLKEASSGELAYCASSKYLGDLRTTKALAVLTTRSIADSLENENTPLLLVAKPELAFAALTKLFSTYPQYPTGVHPSAVVHEGASLGMNAIVCANAVVEKGAVIGDDCVIGSGSVVSEGARIGNGTRLFANVSVYHQVDIGEHCIVHSGASLGSDGFGFVPGPGGLEKLYQLGGLRIGDRVEIGSNCTIDRGALSDTVIGHGVKMDNQVHIAHNVVVGDNTAFAACVGVAGSTRIGANCQFGGQVGINGHIDICDGVTVTGASVVMQSIDEPGVYSGGIPASPNKQWLRNVLRFHQLSDMAKTLKKLEGFDRS